MHISNKDKMIQMDKILYYIKNHMEEDITSEQVAAQFGYSKRHFEKIFREYFEIPFSKYIMKLKR